MYLKPRECCNLWRKVLDVRGKRKVDEKSCKSPGSFAVLIRSWIQGAVCILGMQLSKWAALGYRRASWNLATWWKYLHLRSGLRACTSNACTRIARTRSFWLAYVRARAWGEILPDSVARSVNVLHCVIRHGLWDNVVSVAMATTRPIVSRKRNNRCTNRRKKKRKEKQSFNDRIALWYSHLDSWTPYRVYSS